MDPLYLNKDKIASLLPMQECITVMDTMFRALAAGECLQPLRSLMWLPDRSGLLGMMPGYAKGPGVNDPIAKGPGAKGPGIMGIKVISVFHGNGEAGMPSHQGVVMLFNAGNGQPLMLFDAGEITAIRTAAVSALATRLLAREDARSLKERISMPLAPARPPPENWIPPPSCDPNYLPIAMNHFSTKQGIS